MYGIEPDDKGQCPNSNSPHIRREKSMRVSRLIAKLWKEVFVQERTKLEPGPTQPSPVWIQERVHVAIGEEALQSDTDDICCKWSLSSAPFSTPSQLSVEPAISM